MNFTPETLRELHSKHYRYLVGDRSCMGCGEEWPCTVARLAMDWEAMHFVVELEIHNFTGGRCWCDPKVVQVEATS